MLKAWSIGIMDGKDDRADTGKTLIGDIGHRRWILSSVAAMKLGANGPQKLLKVSTMANVA